MHQLECAPAKDSSRNIANQRMSIKLCCRQNVLRQYTDIENTVAAQSDNRFGKLRTRPELLEV